jgi:hypothetical protein
MERRPRITGESHMISELLVAVVFAGALSSASPGPLQVGQRVALPGDDRATVADFGRRIDAYMDLRAETTSAVLPFKVTADIGEIQRTVDKLAIGIRLGRADARRGDIFSPEIAALFRRMIRTSCHDQFTELLAVINEDWETPLPSAVVHGRWPEGIPFPTMPPYLLAALPRLPPELEYRFINRDLVLRDIDANLIIDFVPEAIPASSWTITHR